eukprot:SAG11_NODE_1243_length_5407_cov_17.705539_1_plen_48_part_00
MTLQHRGTGLLAKCVSSLDRSHCWSVGKENLYTAIKLDEISAEIKEV